MLPARQEASEKGPIEIPKAAVCDATTAEKVYFDDYLIN
jgi:hypothetical protein